MTTGARAPAHRVAGPLRAALAPEALAALAREQLAAFLLARRWFGAKGREPAAVRVADAIPLEPGPFAVAVLDVEFGDGATARYQVPLAVRDSGFGIRDSSGALRPPHAVLAEVESDAGAGVLFDATEDAEFRGALAAAFMRPNVEFGGRNLRLSFERVGTGSDSRLPTPDSRVGSAEQSNTSIIYGDDAVLKLFRRLEPGENPDVEIARFLSTRTDFRNTPALLGVVTISDPQGGEPSVAGMLSRFLAGSGDAWAHALGRVRAYLAAPADRDPPNPFADEARDLGRVTRALHEALSSDEDDPSFAAVFASAVDVAAWADAARRQVAQAFDLLAARAGALDPRSKAPAEALLRRRDAALRRVSEIADGLAEHGDAGLRIRHHGDYHLGQVLRTRDGQWMIIDFEGEPARPLAERRALNSPLRDVAGMMRSFAYAAASGAMEAGGLGVNASLEVRTARWERDARAAFLAGYVPDAREDDEPDTLLPDTREATTALLTLFEIEKIFYELAYELNNRPAWAWIPLRGIAKLF